MTILLAQIFHTIGIRSLKFIFDYNTNLFFSFDSFWFYVSFISHLIELESSLCFVKNTKEIYLFMYLSFHFRFIFVRNRMIIFFLIERGFLGLLVLYEETRRRKSFFNVLYEKKNR